MAKVYSTGPALLFVGLGTSSFVSGLAVGAGNSVFLGTGEQAPDIDIHLEYEPIMNDLGGTRVPFDRAWEGEEAVVSVVLNRHNANVLRAMEALPNPLAAVTPVLGLNISGDIGTLMGQEGCTYRLWVLFPYNLKPAYSDMIPGYMFNSAFLTSPHRVKGGTRDEKVNVTFQCQRGFAVGGALNSPSGLGAFQLYSVDPTYFNGLPAIN